MQLDLFATAYYGDGTVAEEAIDLTQQELRIKALELQAEMDAAWFAEETAPIEADPNEPALGSWAATARMMASCGNDDGFDWDQWKDEMKDREMGL